MGIGYIFIKQVFLTAAVAWIANFLKMSGELNRLSGHNYHKNCELVLDSHIGFEDFAPFENGGFITFSSNHSHFKFVFGTSMRDMLKEKVESDGCEPMFPVLVLPDGTISDAPMEVKDIPKDFEFFPHGVAALGSLDDKKGPLVVVVNHRSTTDSLEVFRVVPTAQVDGAENRKFSLVYIKTISHPLLYNVNDCVFVDENNVYCTNWRSHPTGSFMDAIETYGRMPWSNVVHCDLDINVCAVTATSIKMANGIEITKDRRHVMVVSSMDKSVLVYARKEADNTLEMVTKIVTNSLCDNLSWDTLTEGHGEALLSGCHPKALTFVAYSKSPHTEVAPCEVIRIPLPSKFDKNTKIEVETLYLDPDGSEFPACAVATFTGKSGVNGQLWVGGVHAKGMLRCNVEEMDPPTKSDAMRKLFFL